jgi:uncharacterized protein (DUF58 family)
MKPAGSADAAARASPNAEDVLRRIEWTVLRRLDGALQGNYRTLFRGFGLDLADLREYQVNDDARTIDWNATARLDVPHVRQYNEDRQVTAWFLVDLSGSVNFGSGAATKRAIAVDFVALVARLLARYGNSIGALLYTDRVDAILPARGGRRHVLHLIDKLAATGATQRRGKTTRLDELLDFALQTIKRRSVIILISDFISDGAWAHALAVLGQRHELVAVRLYDPTEMALPDLGLVTVEDAETGEQLFLDTHDPAFRKRFASLAAAREAALRHALAAAGADCIEIATGDDLVHTLLRFTRLRKRSAQLAAGGVPAPAMK